VPAAPTLFGQPFLLPLRAGVTTCRMLYEWVWALVRPTLPSEWP
jgi:hypothetical protein